MMKNEWRQEYSGHDVDPQREPTRTDVFHDLIFFEFTHTDLEEKSYPSRLSGVPSQVLAIPFSSQIHLGWLSIDNPGRASRGPKPLRFPQSKRPAAFLSTIPTKRFEQTECRCVCFSWRPTGRPESLPDCACGRR